MPYRTDLIMGAPGTGKGTQVENILRVYDDKYLVLASGEMLRAVVREGGPLARIVNENNARGTLTDDETMCRIFRDQLHRRAIGERILLLDGIPRTVEQATMLEEDIDVRNIYQLVHKSDELLIERAVGRAKEMIAQGKTPRVDDNPKTMRQRLIVYRDLTLPVIDYYRSLPNAPLIHEIDAERSKDDVWTQLYAAIRVRRV
jgi:adenylate kinase